MPKIEEEPFWVSPCGGHTFWQGHVIDMLRGLPSGSVQCVVTSPPYWGLRDYGTPPVLWGGSKGCRHQWGEELVGKAQRQRNGAAGGIHTGRTSDKLKDIVQTEFKQGSVCLLCGAWRGSYGQEPTPQMYVEHTVEIFREVRRVLRDDGTCWLNLGDTYLSQGGHTKLGDTSQRKGRSNVTIQHQFKGAKVDGLPSGNLVGVPWRVALALQDDGWVLRQDIIWKKKSPMPESVRNRCTKAHEYVFLLTKGMGYYYDAEAIKEPLTEGSVKRYATKFDHPRVWHSEGMPISGGSAADGAMREVPNGRNKRSVWEVGTQPYPGAHFATFPMRLIEPMILAGTSEMGACADCGAPWRRVIDKKKLTRDRPNDHVKRPADRSEGNSCGNTVAGVESVTVGWEQTCKCECVDTVPCVVMDPFAGAGTTACVCYTHGRDSVGVELSEKYLVENAVPRLTDWINKKGKK